MPIVARTHKVGHPQRDGRCYVIEEHQDSAGGVHIVEYLAPVGTDYAAVRDARSPGVADHLAEAEAQALAGNAA